MFDWKAPVVDAVGDDDGRTRARRLRAAIPSGRVVLCIRKMRPITWLVIAILDTEFLRLRIGASHKRDAADAGRKPRMSFDARGRAGLTAERTGNRH